MRTAGSRDTVWVLHAWGSLERQAGNTGLARELFKAAVRVDPKSEIVSEGSPWWAARSFERVHQTRRG
jgi:hypothetical protein